MKVFVTARKPIIAAATGKQFSDEELKVLDGIKYGPIREVEMITEEIAENLIHEFLKMHPGFNNAELEIMRLKR